MSEVLQAEPRQIAASEIESALALMRDASARYDRTTLASLLRSTVPDFNPMTEQVAVAQDSTTVVAFPARNARKV